MVLVVLSVAVMVVDARFTLLKPVRSQMSLVLMQSYWITDLPQRLWQGVASQFGSRTELVAEDPLTCVARGGGRALEMMDKHTMDLLSSE